MSHGRVLYHLVRADFLERVRRYSFLLTLALAVYLGYETYLGNVLVKLADYRGIYNSAWLGGLISLVTTTFLTLAGFYIVKGSIQRDQQTRVGKILATTPMTRGFYTLAKAMSNFVVLAAMVGVMATAALLMQVMRSEDPHIHLWTLLAPILLFALPAMALVSALAVLFETLPVLRGGAGNVIYFFVWIAMLVGTGVGTLDKGRPLRASDYYRDYSGIVTVISQMQQSIRAIDPTYQTDSSITIGGGTGVPTKRFTWDGVHWSAVIFSSRLLWVGISAALALFASVFFHRFDPAKERFGAPRRANRQQLTANHTVALLEEPLSAASVHLTPLLRAKSRTRWGQLIIAELRLMLKGLPWWWYAVAAGLFVATLLSPIEAARGGVALAMLIWPVLIWSQMGSREERFATRGLIYCSEHSLQRQFPASWMAGVLVAIITGGGLGIHLLAKGDSQGFSAWLAGALFIPSLALALGVWSGTSKMFEAVFTLWWYIGPANHVPGADFMGTTPGSSDPKLYFLMAGALLVAAYLGRRAKLAYA